MQRLFIALIVLFFTTVSRADHPPVPSTPAPVNQVLYTRSFILEQPYEHLWSFEKPMVTKGYILVLEVDPDLVIPRDSLEPVLYVGLHTAQRLNSGSESGIVIALVPGDINLKNELIWFGTPELPERISRNYIRNENQKAINAGITPFTDTKLNQALFEGGKQISSMNLDQLLRTEVVRLILKYSPQEKKLAEDLRAPVLSHEKGQRD